MKSFAFPKLLILFTVVPLIELFVLIKAGEALGTLPTVAIVICTGILGAAFSRSQGLSILQKIKSTLQTGQLPGSELIQGLLILVGGVMLVTPGFITDLAGFTLILPSTRKFIAGIAVAYMKTKIESGKWTFQQQYQSPFYDDEYFYDDDNDDDPREIMQ